MSKGRFRKLVEKVMGVSPKSKVKPPHREVRVLDLENEHPVFTKIVNEKEVSLTELSLLLSDKYDIKAIDNNMFKLRKTLIDQAVFNLTGTHAVVSEDDSLKGDIILEFEELAFGLRLFMFVSPTDLHDIFEELTISGLKK